MENIIQHWKNKGSIHIETEKQFRELLSSILSPHSETDSVEFVRWLNKKGWNGGVANLGMTKFGHDGFETVEKLYKEYFNWVNNG